VKHKRTKDGRFDGESSMDSFEAELTRETFDLSRQNQARTKAKTSQRLKYEAEITVLKREMGGLEDIRLKLGFSRRKICQLLMVDPSAWTRWTANESDAPPHIYQALKWYLDSKSFQVSRVEEELNNLKRENARLNDDLTCVRAQISRMMIGVAFIGVLAVILWLFKF
jgi:transcriptional regulator with XRE-family HTH domain